MNRRREQRSSAILRAVQEVLSRGLGDPRVRGLITVTGLKMTDDDRTAVVSVSVLPGEHQDLTLHGLNAARAHIRREAMDRIRVREMPALEFRPDESIKKQAELLTAINRAAAERPETSEDGADGGGDPAGGERDGDGA